MKAAELRKLSQDDLLDKLKEVTEELNKFYSLPKEKIEKPREKSKLRHERARIMTLLNETKS
jgi:ribosomal protein L29